MSGSDGLPICGVRGLALEDVDRERKVNEMVEFLARLESTNPRVSERRAQSFMGRTGSTRFLWIHVSDPNLTCISS